ncbi:hypothetical protein CONLIGDRAFT_680356 [Coniochaeta ligniaria NRRL 30616]|uniref:Zn(2)-C6 fungal-type domain-containing protein n=1 Tax=Coniochaeta ligniaria NRRL 30616 TaxID=1408157 RepID=A0A1J7JIB9_9PEZI|nr:hypothetical protein CONLIGDRAFT_680356 [Coniochaeta ligniaria NRRL 30616]
MPPGLLQADATPPSPSPASPAEDAPRRKTRTRMSTACGACRGRRTKCDGRRPACGYCRTRGFECQYESTLRGPTSRVEAELAAINQRLDHITRLLPSGDPADERPGPGPCINGHQQAYTDVDHAQANVAHHVLTSQDFTSQEISPFQLLGSESIMEILGLGRDFGRELLRLERDASAAVVGLPGNAPRVRMMQQQQALEALAAFSTYIHVWFPVLRPGFSDRYFRVISGPLMPGPESCLVLMVAAVGSVARQDPVLGHDNNLNNMSNNQMIYEDYLDVATASLPSVLVDGSIESVQCLVLLSIYYCCLSKPYQAYEYAMVASFKVQNLLKELSTRPDDGTGGDGELHEHAKRAYWAVLLIESELRVQFDVVESGIWDHDDQIALPDSRRTWEFNVELGSPQSSINSCTSPPSHASVITDNNRAHSYFLAEISMRRMLHRCNTAIRRTSPQGAIVYAPHIASELELQLDEWYGVLPDTVRFQLDLDFNPSHDLFPSIDPLANFLRVQYFCCKISIYWPAVYQSIQDGSPTTTPETLRHCERFFAAYIRLMPSMLTSIRDCIVNRWTLYASIFMTSMAVILAAQTPCLRAGCAVDWARLAVCLRSTRTVDRRIVQASPSLSLLDSALARRLAEVQTLLGGIDGMGCH